MEMQLDSAPSANSNWVIDGTTETFGDDVVNASEEKLVVVDLWAPWCGPCKQLKPVLERLVSAENGKVKLVKVNTEDHPGIASQLRVMAIPAVFAFKDGKPVDPVVWMGSK